MTNHTAKNGGVQDSLHTTPEETPLRTGIPKATLSLLMRFYRDLVIVDNTDDYSFYMALAHLHEWLAYRLTSDAAIKRHANQAVFWYECAEEAKHKEPNPRSRYKPSWYSRHFIAKHYAQRGESEAG